MRHIALSLVALAVGMRGVAAQATLPIDVGQRVRLTLEPGWPAVVGVLVAQDGDSLRVQPHPHRAPVAIRRARVTGVAVSEGRHGHAGTGALAGLVFGAVVGAAAGESCEGDLLCPGPGGGALLLGGTGTVLGALVGVLARSERWQPVYPDEVGVAVVKMQRGLGVGVSIDF